MNLWNQLVEYIKIVIAVTRRVDRHDEVLADLRETSKSMQAEMRAMAERIRELEYEVRRDRENAAHEQDKLLLRIQILLERANKSLPGVDVSALPPPES